MDKLRGIEHEMHEWTAQHEYASEELKVRVEVLSRFSAPRRDMWPCRGKSLRKVEGTLMRARSCEQQCASRPPGAPALPSFQKSP